MLSKKLYKFLILIVIILIVIILILVYIKKIGYFFDITVEPTKSDVILCLGGDSGNRIYKVIDLYKKHYSNKIILTSKYKKSINKKRKILNKYNIKEKDIISNDNTLTTYEELKFVKSIMKKHNYKSLIIVTFPPHSRRIKILIDNFIHFDNETTYRIIKSDIKWWDKDTFYKNNHAILFLIKESLKIIYNYIFYSVDEIVNFEKETISKMVKFKVKVFKFLNFY